MTDQQTLFTYRMNAAEETLTDARAMLAAEFLLGIKELIATGERP